LIGASNDQSTVPELALTLDSARRLAAADLGELFSTLARDYRQFTRGRTLVVVRLQTGSLYAYFRDAFDTFEPYGKEALEIVKTVKSIKEFVQTLAGVFRRAKEHPGTLAELRNQRQVGAKSIDAFLKIAAKSQSVVQLRHRTAEGEIIDLKVTPIEAIQIRKNSKAGRASVPSPRTQTIARFPGENSPPLSFQSSPVLFQPSVALMQSLISAGLGSLISGIASNLESPGLPKSRSGASRRIAVPKS
jgi:hypothetical protein